MFLAHRHGRSRFRRLAVWTSHIPQYEDTTQTEPPIAHLTTFLIGYAVFQVFGHFAPGTASIGDDLIYAKALVTRER
jgi:hypothetical protein